MEIEGTYDQIVERLSKDTGLDEDAADAILNMIMDNPELLDSVKIEHGKDVHQRGMSGLLFDGDKYYISMRRSIIPLTLLVIPVVHYALTGIDSTIIINAVFSFMPALASIIHDGGLEDKVILLDERNGEKCILLEMLKSRRESITAEIIKKQMGNVCEEEYRCDFKKNGKCTCSENKIEGILETLKDRKVLKGGSAGYRYIV